MPQPELGSSVGTAPPPGWPYVSKLELGSLPAAVGCGRDHARQILSEWGFDRLIEDAVLIASELLTQRPGRFGSPPRPATNRPPAPSQRGAADHRGMGSEPA